MQEKKGKKKTTVYKVWDFCYSFLLMYCCAHNLNIQHIKIIENLMAAEGFSVFFHVITKKTCFQSNACDYHKSDFPKEEKIHY